MANEIPAYQFNCIPGNANQGALLTTRNDITRPPFTQDDFIWVAMEDIIGVANIKLEYDEEENLYKLYKAKGHRLNDGTWVEDYIEIGRWEPISEEVAQALRDLKYVNYRYDTTVANVLKVYGVKKDMTEDLLCNISFISKAEFEDFKTLIQTNLTNEINRATGRENTIESNLNTEINRATTRENQLEDLIETNKSTYAIPLKRDNTTKVVSVDYDNNNIIIKNDKLTTNVIDDLNTRTDKTWSSEKIGQMLSSGVRYMGQVATYADLPTTGQTKGDMYNVVDTGDNYVWSGTGWDKLSGDYIAGAGIEIIGKTIKATSVSFKVGDGLKTEGSGDETTLSTRINDGLEYTNVGTSETPINAIKVKTDQGLEIHNGGVRAKIGNGIMYDSNNAIKVKGNANAGIDINANGVAINTNFANNPNPLGTNISGLIRHSDGKISVDFKGQKIEQTILYDSETTTASAVYIELSDSIDNYLFIVIQDDAATIICTPTNLKAYYQTTSGIDLEPVANQCAAYTRNYTYVDNTHINAGVRNRYRFYGNVKETHPSRIIISGLRMINE